LIMSQHSNNSWFRCHQIRSDLLQLIPKLQGPGLFGVDQSQF
jgi:hypothetical protein